jgi:hypothetical protein
MIPIPEIPKGKGRLILLFSKYDYFDFAARLFDLKEDSDDIEAFLLRMNVGAEMYYMLRVERPQAPYPIDSEGSHLVVPGAWRERARYIFREQNDGPLVQMKASGGQDPAEVEKVVAALITLSMPIYKGRMGMRIPTNDGKSGLLSPNHSGSI